MTTLLVISIIAIVLIGLLAAGEILVGLVLLEALRRWLLRARREVPWWGHRAKALLTKANQVAVKAKGRVTKIATGAETVSVGMLRFAENASWVAQRVMALPVIETIAAARGLRQGLRVWQVTRARRKARVARPVSLQPSTPPLFFPEEAAPQVRKRAA